jgi:hypothetical protein
MNRPKGTSMEERLGMGPPGTTFHSKMATKGGDGMWNEPTPEQLAKIPRLYETENTPLKGKLIHLHCFIGDCDWFVSEYDGQDLFFGYAIIGNSESAEWGYISFTELKHVKILPGIEVDCEIFDPARRHRRLKR